MRKFLTVTLYLFGILFYLLEYLKYSTMSTARISIQTANGVLQPVKSDSAELLLLISSTFLFALVWYISASITKKLKAFIVILLLNILLFICTLYLGDVPGLSLGSDFNIIPILALQFSALSIFPLLYIGRDDRTVKM